MIRSFRGVDARKQFVALAEALRGSTARISVATHDCRFAEASLRVRTDAKTPCELELRFSLPLGILDVAKAAAVPVRVYTPHGHPYLPYNIAHIRTRPGIALWSMKNFIVGSSGPYPHLEDRT